MDAKSVGHIVDILCLIYLEDRKQKVHLHPGGALLYTFFLNQKADTGMGIYVFIVQLCNITQYSLHVIRLNRIW